MNCAEIFFLTIMVLSSGNGMFAGLAEVAPNTMFIPQSTALSLF